MARKTYSPEFRRQAVDLYRSTPNATLKGIAEDLGISRHTLHVWGQALDPDRSTTVTTTDTSGAPVGPGSSAPGAPAPRRTGSAGAELAALQARVAVLQAENAALVAEQTKLATERDILRQAAKYFAGETRW